VAKNIPSCLKEKGDPGQMVDMCWMIPQSNFPLKYIIVRPFMMTPKGSEKFVVAS